MRLKNKSSQSETFPDSLLNLNVLCSCYLLTNNFYYEKKRTKQTIN